MGEEEAQAEEVAHTVAKVTDTVWEVVMVGDTVGEGSPVMTVGVGRVEVVGGPPCVTEGEDVVEPETLVVVEEEKDRVTEAGWDTLLVALLAPVKE